MIKIISVFSAVACILSLPGTQAWGVGNGNPFIKGLNQPWGDGVYGHYLAPEPANPSWGYTYSASETASYLQAFNQAGATLWRFWLFEAGQGLILQNGQPTGIDPTLFQSMDNIVSQAGNAGVKLYPTLFAGQPGSGDLDIMPNFITDINTQNNLINNVVIPLARRYAGNGNIGAFQVYNELNNWCNPYFGSTVGTQQQCNTFVSRVVQAIKSVDGSRLVSISNIQINDQWHPADQYNKDFVGTGVDFYDIHVYNDDGSLPSASTYGLDKPVILGEFGETSGQGPAHQATVVGNFLNNALNQGWAGALYWALGEPGQNPQFQGCDDNTLTLYLIGCNGTPRSAFNTIANLHISTGINPGGVYEVQVAGGRSGCFPYLSSAQCSTPNTPNLVDLFSNDDGSGRQRWQFNPVSGKTNTYTLQIANGRSGCNDYLSAIACGGTTPNLVDLYGYDDGSGHQQWVLNPVAGQALTFNVENVGRSGCNQYLSSAPCGSNLVDLYGYDDGSGRQQWVLTQV